MFWVYILAKVQFQIKVKIETKNINFFGHGQLVPNKNYILKFWMTKCSIPFPKMWIFEKRNSLTLWAKIRAYFQHTSDTHEGRLVQCENASPNIENKANAKQLIFPKFNKGTPHMLKTTAN